MGELATFLFKRIESKVSDIYEVMDGSPLSTWWLEDFETYFNQLQQLFLDMNKQKDAVT